MKLNEAKMIAESVLAQLSPHCTKCEIAGSIRRQKEIVKDIDIVLIPKPFDIGFLGMLEEGIAKVLKQWPCTSGKLQTGVKYLQYQLPQGIKLDLFFAEPDNWGVVLARRTGSERFTIDFTMKAKDLGYKWDKNFLLSNGQIVPIADEHILFEKLNISYVPAFFRR